MLQDPGWYVKHAHARTRNTHPAIPAPMHQQSSQQPRGRPAHVERAHPFAATCRQMSSGERHNPVKSFFSFFPDAIVYAATCADDTRA